MKSALALVAVVVLSGTRTSVPAAVTIATASGETVVEVRSIAGHAALPIAPLALALPAAATVSDGWAVVSVSGRAFKFLLDAPLYIYQARTVPLVSGARVVDDTLFLPLEWLAEHLPRAMPDTYHYDTETARLEVQLPQPVIASESLAPVRSSAPPVRVAPSVAPASAVRRGLRLSHTVVIDAGHGGVDAGNPGYFFPRGVLEKDVTLAIARALRDSLQQRGVSVTMTRDRDTLIALGDRAPMCKAGCDLFVSIHVNSVEVNRRGFEKANGLETYYLAVQGSTQEANRVAAMENDALRYESGGGRARNDPMSTILKDLQYNEYLRESAVLADLIQRSAAAVQPGGDHGISQAPFMVLKTAVRPAVLIETGYATNRADGGFLASTVGQRRLAGAIADGVVSYLRQYEEKVGGGDR